MSLNTAHLLRTADTLEQALLAIGQQEDSSVLYDLYRNATIKSFELSLETAGKLLRKALKAYSATPHSVDALMFNDVLRHAGKHSLFSSAEVERWLHYRANLNNTAHDYGEAFANQTLVLLPGYLTDVRQLAPRIQAVFDGQT